MNDITKKLKHINYTQSKYIIINFYNTRSIKNNGHKHIYIKY